MTFFLVGLVAALAFANGANDNSKGVATLVGVRAARPAQALAYATIATALGGAVSFFLAGGLLKGFSGNWLFATGVILDQHFYAAVLIGACGWVLLANRTGMPVSTTHAIVGAMSGAGLVAFGGGRFQWNVLGEKVAMPLALSPALSLAIVYGIASPVVWGVSAWAHRRVAREKVAVGAVSRNFADQIAFSENFESERAESNSSVAHSLHWLSSGLTSFARGWNDTPKIAALSLVALGGVRHGMALGFAVVTVAMAAGGLIMGRKVLETLAKKLTPLPLAESLTASMVTAALVSLASWMALPVSTTHVATGSIVGAGLKHNPAGVKWGKVGEILLSWIVTVPAAALLAMAAMRLLR